MSLDKDTAALLREKLDQLKQRQDEFSHEIKRLEFEIERLNSAESSSKEEETPILESVTVTEPIVETHQEEPIASPIPPQESTSRDFVKADNTKKQAAQPSFNLEKFIGENLINKIGIAITVIGVAIGAKYSIEHELISPLTRIILGYLAGLGLLGFGIKLKKNYENYSAVLVSGAMSILYFITFAGYSFYALFPQTMAFLLMLCFTAFTVVAAVNYNRQLIAHIGLVGAYAVPFLLSDGSGRVAILFSYMAIINTGILVLSFKKYWRGLFYSSFSFTWLIFLFWYGLKYQRAEHFSIALSFASIFFLLFYVSFIAYKLLRKEKFEIQTVVLLLLNSFLFYGVGFGILSGHAVGKDLLGLFTLINAIIHFIVSAVIYRNKLADRNLFYLVSGLVLVFLTISIPVQLDGNWVTLLWVGEAALLFWIGRSRKMPVYERLSYPLLFLAFMSLWQDWQAAYTVRSYEQMTHHFTPVLNTNLLSSLLFIVALVFINRQHYVSRESIKEELRQTLSWILPVLLAIVVFYSFELEIAHYWDMAYQTAMESFYAIEGENMRYHNYEELKSFKAVWIINYSLLFVSAMAFINQWKIKNAVLGTVNSVFIGLALLLFLGLGLYELSELREMYLNTNLPEYVSAGPFYIAIRYVSLGFVALSILALRRFVRKSYMKMDFVLPFDLVLSISLVWILSSELIHWMDMAHASHSYKLALSIFWGISSLGLIVLGIWKVKKHLRIEAFVLFGITLLKLFFYDISHLNTISKTIVFVSLGVLLLIISFLYNKYKRLIANETE